MDIQNKAKGYLSPSVTFIANAAFAIMLFVGFLIIPAVFKSVHVYDALEEFGPCLAMFLFFAACAGSVVLPLITKRIAHSINFSLMSIVLFTIIFFEFHWNFLTFFLVFFVIVPWAALTLLAGNDKVGFTA